MQTISKICQNNHFLFGHIKKKPYLCAQNGFQPTKYVLQHKLTNFIHLTNKF